jgi:antiphage defense system Thoeris ThsB-like protein
MARRVFFSFHHQKDSWRVAQVRNSWLAQKGESNKFMDAAAWEEVKRKGDAAVKAWIDQELNGTGVTVVLIGQETASRPFVRYEIEESFRKKNGLLGIHIHAIRNSDKKKSRKGRNPLDDFTASVGHPWLAIFGYKTEKRYSEIFETFDWVKDDGRKNMGYWIEEAARRAGRQ